MKCAPSQVRYALNAALLLISLPGICIAASGPKKLPVCDGKHLRDVNIYGSVLPGSPIPATVESPAPPPVPKIAPPDKASGTPPPPVPDPAAAKTSALSAPRQFRSC